MILMSPLVATTSNLATITMTGEQILGIIAVNLLMHLAAVTRFTPSVIFAKLAVLPLAKVPFAKEVEMATLPTARMKSEAVGSTTIASMGIIQRFRWR